MCFLQQTSGSQRSKSQSKLSLSSKKRVNYLSLTEEGSLLWAAAPLPGAAHNFLEEMMLVIIYEGVL